VYGSLFETEGYRVSAMTECAIAPSDVLGLHPDLLIIDLRCGTGLRGLDFLRRLREEPGGEAVPVIASTPASVLDMGMHESELRALNVAIFDGPSQFEDMIAAARLMTARRKRSVSLVSGDGPESPLGHESTRPDLDVEIGSAASVSRLGGGRSRR
jgi:DNA-binding response OmpR family regulator